MIKIKISQIYFINLLIQQILKWLALIIFLFLLGEIILPGWVSSQINLFQILFITLSLVLISEFLKMYLSGQNSINQKFFFILKLTGAFLAALVIFSVLLFQINFSYLIIIVIGFLLISYFIFHNEK